MHLLAMGIDFQQGALDANATKENRRIGPVNARWVAQKVSHWTKCNFSTTDRNFSTKMSGFTADAVFNKPCKFHRNTFIVSRITAVTIFHYVFENYAEEMDSHL